MKKIWAIRKDAEAVSPVIATILMVAITVVLAAVLYVMVLGFGGGGTQTPTSSLSKVTPAPDYGVKYQFAPMSKDTAWSDVSILISDGTNTVSWAPLTSDLDGGATVKYSGAMKEFTAGGVQVWCNITDLAGNGYVNQGDFFTLTSGSTAPAGPFSSSTTYTVTVMYDPSSSKVCDATFQGS